MSQLETTTDAAYIFEISTKIIHMESSAGLGTIVTFIGIYLGIIFLISSAAVLALKELSDHLDNKVRYEMLRKIGVDEKMIHHSMLQQTAIFFGLPLLLAMIHSVFGGICEYGLLSVSDSRSDCIDLRRVFSDYLYDRETSDAGRLNKEWRKQYDNN